MRIINEINSVNSNKHVWNKAIIHWLLLLYTHFSNLWYTNYTHSVCFYTRYVCRKKLLDISNYNVFVYCITFSMFLFYRQVCCVCWISLRCAFITQFITAFFCHFMIISITRLFWISLSTILLWLSTGRIWKLLSLSLFRMNVLKVRLKISDMFHLV